MVENAVAKCGFNWGMSIMTKFYSVYTNRLIALLWLIHHQPTSSEVMETTETAATRRVGHPESSPAWMSFDGVKHRQGGETK